jgi:hypothetical protein
MIAEVIRRSFMAGGVVGKCCEFRFLEVEFGAAEELEGACCAGPDDFHHVESFHAFGEAYASLGIGWMGSYCGCVG